MIETAALRVALNLLHVPSSLKRVRNDPLPAGVPVLLRIVAGDQDAEHEAARRTERSVDMVREASAFFVEQILLTAGADSYRSLGADASADAGDLRRNMAMLLRWLHPDMIHSQDRKVLVERVTLAWENLKTAERRAAYDSSRERSETGVRKSSRQKPKPGAMSSRSAHAAHRHLAPRSHGSGRQGDGEGDKTSLLQRAMRFLSGRWH